MTELKFLGELSL